MPVAPLDRDRPKRRRRPSATARARAQERQYVSQGKALEHAARQQRATPKPSTPSLGRTPPRVRQSPVGRAKTQERQYVGQGKAVKRAAADQRKAARKRREVARRKTFSSKPAEALQRKITRGEHALAMLQASDPKEYARRHQEHEDRKAFGLNYEKLAREGNKGLVKAGEEVKKHLATNKSNGPGLLGHPTQAGGLGDATREVLDLVVNAPTSAYMAGHALNKATEGNTKPAKKLWKDFKKTSAVAAAASGDWGEAVHRAGERPVTTALELSGAKALVGRTAGAVMRGAPPVKGFHTVRKAASQERPNLRLYPDELPGHGPQQKRVYSKDVINKAAQKYGERYVRKGSRVRKDGTQRRPGRDPHVDRGTYLVPASPLRKGAAGKPNPHRLTRRVDTRYFQEQRLLEDRRRSAEHAARKDIKQGRGEAANVIARADLIRAHLRQRMHDLQGEDRKHMREVIALPDDRLIDFVEASARTRRGLPQERVVQGLTPEQAPIAVKSLERRVRRGKTLTPGQAAAMVHAVGKQIERDVQQRAKGQPLKTAEAEGTVGYHTTSALDVGGAKNAPIHLGDLPAARARADYLRGQGDKVVTHRITLPSGLKLVDLKEPKGAPKHGPSQTDRIANEIEQVLRLRRDDPGFNPAAAENTAHLRGAAKLLDAMLAKGIHGLRYRNNVEGGVSTLLFDRSHLGPTRIERRSAERPGPRIEPLRPEDFQSYLDTLRRREPVAPKAILPAKHDVELAAARPDPADVPLAVGRRAMHEAGQEHRVLMANEFGIPVGKKGFRSSRDGVQKWIDRRFPDHDLVPLQRADREWVAVPRVVADRLAAHRSVDEGPFRPGGAFDRSTSVFKDVVLTSASPSRWLGGNVGDIGMRTLFAGITPLDITRGFKIDRNLKKLGTQGEEASQALHQGGLYTTGGQNSIGADLRGSGASISKANVPRHMWRLWKRGIYSMEHAIETLPLYGTTGKAFRQSTSRTARMKVNGPEPDTLWNSGPIHEFMRPMDTELGVRAPMGKHDEWAAGDYHMKRSLKSMLKLQDEAMEAYAKDIAGDRALEAMLQKNVEDVMGRWGKVSPAMRRTLSVAPFAQWLGAATRYVYVTLPAHHPIKTAIAASITEMTESERKRLGLSYFAPLDKRAPDYQMGMLPTDVGKNKYGPVVEGTRTSRMTSLGTAGSTPWNLPEFLLPQISSGLNALRGQSFTGEPLVHPANAGPDKEGLPLDFSELLPVALGAQAESMVPFASAFRRTVLERGRPADPSSTILTPQVRLRFDYDKKKYVEDPGSLSQGLKEWGMPFAPKSRIYTLGAGRDIERSQNTLKTLDKWQKRQKAKRERAAQYGPATPKKRGSDDFWSTDTPKPKVRSKAPANDFWK